MDTGCRPSPTAGNALVQWRHTVTAVDPGIGEVAIGASNVAAVAAMAGAEALASGASSGVAAVSAVAAVAGAGANQTDALVASPDPSNIVLKELIDPSNTSGRETIYPSDTLSKGTADPSNLPSEKTSYPSNISPNEPVYPSNDPSEDTSSPILANETGPSKNTPRLPSSEPRISQERIEPFGYPGAGLVVELHMPKVTLRELHSSSRGSLAEFLSEVRKELGKGAEVQESRLSILGIHGRYKRSNDDGFFRLHSTHISGGMGHMVGSEHMQEEVVVRFEILPGWAQDPDPQSALNVLKQQLSSPDSELKRGPLGLTLANATVQLSSQASIASSSGMNEHRGMAHMSAMAWPIGISAAFIGVLIWLAAY